MARTAPQGDSLFSSLVTQGPLLLDGAWGTQLQARGLAPGEIPDHWNVTEPGKVEEVAGAYAQAGSHIILTNTFRANHITLGRPMGDPYVREVNRKGVEISCRAAAGRARVFASIGPSGKLLVMGEVQEEDLLGAFTEQASALAEGGAAAIVLETMSDLDEAKLALAAAKKTGLPVVACMVFDSGKNRDRTMMGTKPEEAAAELAEAGADAVGANCGTGIESYISICRRMHETVDLPIWIKPNAGVPTIVDGRTVYRTTPKEFAVSVAKLLDAGATFVGGCCGTSPTFIRAVAELLHNRVS